MKRRTTLRRGLFLNHCNIYWECWGKWLLIVGGISQWDTSEESAQRCDPSASFCSLYIHSPQKAHARETWTRSWPFSLVVCVLVRDLCRFTLYWLFPTNLNYPHPLLNLADVQVFFFERGRARERESRRTVDGTYRRRPFRPISSNMLQTVTD